MKEFLEAIRQARAAFATGNYLEAWRYLIAAQDAASKLIVSLADGPDALPIQPEEVDAAKTEFSQLNLILTGARMRPDVKNAHAKTNALTGFTWDTVAVVADVLLRLFNEWLGKRKAAPADAVTQAKE